MIDSILEFLTAHPTEYRWIAGVLGFFASLTHAFRLVTYWHRVTLLIHTWGLIILAFSMACSMGQAIALERHAPPSELTLVIGAIQVSVIVAALTFPWLFARPAMRQPATPLATARR